MASNIDDTSNAMKTSMEKLDESLRSKYMEILTSLTFDEIKKFNKGRYKELIKSDIIEQLPDAKAEAIDLTAQCISNMLHFKAIDLRGTMRKQHQITNKSSKPTNLQSEDRVTRQSSQMKTSAEPLQQQHKEVELSDTLLQELDNSMLVTNNTDGHKTSQTKTKDTDFSDTLLQELDNTMMENNDSLDATVTTSQLDATYEDEYVSDDSVTRVKTVHQSNGRKRKGKKTSITAKQTRRSKGNGNKSKDNNDISCIQTCSIDYASASIRCNLCMNWYHTVCVHITDMNSVGAWVCDDCRVLPQTVKSMQHQLQTLLTSTGQILESVNALTSTMKNKISQIDDRITALSNQQKCFDKSYTDSLSDIGQDVNKLKTDMDKKTSSIITGSQSLYDKINATPGLVGKTVKQIIDDKLNKDQTLSNENSTRQKTPIASNTSKEYENPDSVIIIEDENTQTKPAPPKVRKADLTLITGSCILKGIETKHLADKVRVKSFKSAKIDDLKDSLSKMDLSRYQDIVIHIGGHDIDGNIKPAAFRQKYQALLDSLISQNLKVHVSGLLPRGQKNVKPFNDILVNLSQNLNIDFIANHDSFVLASGDCPFDFFHPDRINLKFAGIRTLVRNIHSSCKVLPKRENNIPHLSHERQGQHQYRRRDQTYSGRSFRQ